MTRTASYSSTIQRASGAAGCSLLRMAMPVFDRDPAFAWNGHLIEGRKARTGRKPSTPTSTSP
ncbi:hypothetical protein [Leisingera caerulea]|uniref:hypothetical protein n=1 Tax=Leisingera caerulea TaxID=506591 RepID=UPI0004884C13|nr:hypothetical protein [Leisingera caerulea]